MTFDLDDSRVAELIDALAWHGIDVDTRELTLDDPHALLDRIISACRDAASSEQLYQEPEAVAGPVQMSIAGHPARFAVQKNKRECRAATEKAVDDFFSMLPSCPTGRR